MTARLILMSHAPTAALRTASFPGDEPLHPFLQALPEKAAAIAPPGGLDHLLRGPEIRTAETAAALGLASPFTVDPALRDCDYGRWTGRRFDDLQREEPEAIASWLADPGAAPHGGEPLLALLARVAAWLDERGREGGRVLAVTHPAVIRAAMVHALEAPPRSFWRINVEPLAIVDLRANRGRWTLRAWSES